MTQPVLYTDDTPIRTLAPGTGKTRLSRFWVGAAQGSAMRSTWNGSGGLCCGSSTLRRIGAAGGVLLATRADRKGERPREHLAGFSGVMHADAFAGYDALYRSTPGQPPPILHAACWAHARRKLFEVHESTKSPIAEEALAAHPGAVSDRGRHHPAALLLIGKLSARHAANLCSTI